MEIFLSNYPKLDLHGYDRDSAVVALNDFVDENFLLGKDCLIVVHGIGLGIVKDACLQTLKKNKKVLDYYICPNNIGCTVVKLKINK